MSWMALVRMETYAQTRRYSPIGFKRHHHFRGKVNMSVSIQRPAPQNLLPLDSQNMGFSQGSYGQNGQVSFGLGDSSPVNFGSLYGADSNSLNHSFSNKSIQDPSGANNVEQSLKDILEMLKPLIQQLLMLLQGGQQHAPSNNSAGNEKGSGGKGNAPVTFGNEGQPRDVSFAAQSPSGKEGEARANDAGDGQTVKPGNGITSVNAGNAPMGMPQGLWQNCVKAGEKYGVDPFVLAAQAKQESNWGQNMANGDGVMQVEAATRSENTGMFRQQAGHEYDHSSQADQIEMAAMIMSNLGGDTRSQLEKYNSGPNWQPGSVDSFQRTTDPQGYAQKVIATAEELRSSVA